MGAECSKFYRIDTPRFLWKIWKKISRLQIGCKSEIMWHPNNCIFLSFFLSSPPYLLPHKHTHRPQNNNNNTKHITRTWSWLQVHQKLAKKVRRLHAARNRVLLSGEQLQSPPQMVQGWRGAGRDGTGQIRHHEGHHRQRDARDKTCCQEWRRCLQMSHRQHKTFH